MKPKVKGEATKMPRDHIWKEDKLSNHWGTVKLGYPKGNLPKSWKH